jgi:hypothetical protein
MIRKHIYLGLITVVMFISTALGPVGLAAERNPPPKAIVGSWVETITVTGPGGPPPFKSIGVYTADGTLVFSDQGGVTLDPPQSFSATVGSWTYVRERTFAWTAIALISDLSGNHVGTLKVRGETTMDPSGDSYTSRFRAEMFDPNGVVLFAADGTNVGQRVGVEPLP